MWVTQGNVLRSSLSLGKEALEKPDEKDRKEDREGNAGCGERGAEK